MGQMDQIIFVVIIDCPDLGIRFGLW